MRVNIDKKKVKLEDETGHALFISTEQLKELVDIVNGLTTVDDTFRFDTLEFTV